MDEESVPVSYTHLRKLAVKALAEMTVHTEQITEKQVTLDVDGEEGIYLKKCPVELLQLFTAKRDIYRIKEEIKIPDVYKRQDYHIR